MTDAELLQPTFKKGDTVACRYHGHHATVLDTKNHMGNEFVTIEFIDNGSKKATTLQAHRLIHQQLNLL